MGSWEVREGIIGNIFEHNRLKSVYSAASNLSVHATFIVCRLLLRLVKL